MLVRVAGDFFTFLFFVTAGITFVAGESATEIEGRVSYADGVGIVLIALAMFRLASRGGGLEVPLEYKAYIPLLVVFTLGVIAAEEPGRGALELIIHIFVYLVSFALFQIHRKRTDVLLLPHLLNLLLYAGGILAAVNLVDLFAMPGLLPGSNLGGLSGTFRNSGQAGAFFGVYFAILVPAFLSRAIRPSFSALTAFTAITLALIFTFKRAAILGAAVGLILAVILILVGRERRGVAGAIVVLAIGAAIVQIGLIAFDWGMSNVEHMSWRFEHKFRIEAVDEFASGFAAENVATALAALEARPVLGVGLGNVSGILSSHEIHSTYLSILGNCGLLGAVTYGLLLASVIFRMVTTPRETPEGHYLRYFWPFLIGLMISWAYTYHLRKREFWILFFLIAVVTSGARWSYKRQPRVTR